MAYKTIKVKPQDQIIWLTLNRPERLNAISHELLYEMIDFFEMMEPMQLFKVVAELRSSSTSEAIRLIKGGAVRVMEGKITDTKYIVTPGQDKVIRVGKKFFRIKKG